MNFMKILFITDLYPIKQGEATTAVTLHNFVFEWIRQGNEVDVIKPNFILNSFLRKKPFYKDGFYDYQGVRIFNVNYFTPFLFDFTKKLPKELDFESYDVIISHMPSGIIFANKLAKTIKKPLVCGVHASDIEVMTNPIYKFYFKSQLQEGYKNAKKIACRSFVLQKKFNALMPEFAEKTFVAASGIDCIGAPSPRTFSDSAIKVLTCANLIKRKNIDKLILAIKDLDEFELKVMGSGAELNKLKKITAKNVEFSGQLPHKKVLKEMRNSDIFILPSINETFGMVYLEAMASGCVTVCTENDGVDGIINDGENGFLCPATAEGIKETLLKIKSSENIEKILQKSFETIKDYTSEKCAKNYLEKIEIESH